MSGANSQGVQQLLAAEKKASEIVKNARAHKAKRLKDAKVQADAEIEKYRNECETAFKQKEASHDGETDTAMIKITSEKVTKLNVLDTNVRTNKEAVILKLLEITMQVEPKVHINFKA
eukprot:m.12301 g.12301  ORF g.12301 m.12301 type:complete len:118 (+) comp17400_c0_seq1:190-543(+)